MVRTNVSVWKTFAIARDSSDGIGTAMKSAQKTAKARDKKETQTNAKKKQKRNQRIWKCEKSMFLKQAKPETKSQSRRTNAMNAAVLSAWKTQPSCNKYCTDSTNE